MSSSPPERNVGLAPATWENPTFVRQLQKRCDLMSHELPTALSLCETAWAQGGYLAAKLAALACVAQRRGTVTMWDDTGQIIVRGHPSEALQTVFYWPDGRRVAIPVPVRPRPQQG